MGHAAMAQVPRRAIITIDSRLNRGIETLGEIMWVSGTS
jgi:hypothetical protein